MINKEVVLTFEGLKKLEQELEYLKSVKRREVAERIKQALSFGDISENSEYDEAKNEQAQVEGRIVQLEGMLKRALPFHQYVEVCLVFVSGFLLHNSPSYTLHKFF